MMPWRELPWRARAFFIVSIAIPIVGFAVIIGEELYMMHMLDQMIDTLDRVGR